MNLHKFVFFINRPDTHWPEDNNYTSLDKATQSLTNNSRDKNAYVFGSWILWTTLEFGVFPTLFIIYSFVSWRHLF